jgi:flavocytochrome c
VGSGLAGLTAALTIIDRGGRVVILEKQATLGGNSIKASSGINACCQTTPNDDPNDTINLFTRDTTISAGRTAQPALIDVLVKQSASTIAWLQERLDLQIDQVAQLGGHSVPRTHRPTDGMIGATLIGAMANILRDNVDQCTILTQAVVTSLVTDENGLVTGVIYSSSNDKVTHTIYAPHTILATGGFAADPYWLQRVRPELSGFGTTAGSFSTGDGLTLAGTATTAATIDLDLIQLHPTGFVDTENPKQRSKVLAAEVLRGVGGILLTDQGHRVANELGLRSEVTKKMLEYADTSFVATGTWNIDQSPPVMNLILSGTAAEKAKSHVTWYVSRGLLHRFQGLDNLANHLQVPVQVLEQTFSEYRDYAKQGSDPFGKTTFPDLFEDGVYYVGSVTPVLHYCMGGLKINTSGQVLNDQGLPIGGLYAIGETAGGVHGDNRLGGNSLLECAVFGTVVGKTISISPPRLDETTALTVKPLKTLKGSSVVGTSSRLRPISISEMKRHASDETCWVALRDRVYDLTDFAIQHAGGKDPIRLFCGKDATETFHMIHSSQVMDRLADLPAVGLWAE